MDSKNSIINIDGSILEGGGQILRNASALSCLLGKPICIDNIRAKRSNPGLRAQHLNSLLLLNNITGGKLEGAEIGSTCIKFFPGPIKGGNFEADTKTAGSVCLLIQAILPCLLFADKPSEVLLKGGTNATMAPQIDYLSTVFQEVAKSFGISFNCEIKRRGYFPKGGGIVVLKVKNITEIKSITLKNRGDIKNVYGRSFVSGVLPIKIAERMSDRVRKSLEPLFPDLSINIDNVKESENMSPGNASGILIVGSTSTGCVFGSDGLGKQGIPAETVGNDASRNLIENLNHGGCVDEHLQDQVIIFMALAEGRSEILCGPITLHTETAIYIAEKLAQAKFEIENQQNGQVLLKCDGIGFKKV